MQQNIQFICHVDPAPSEIFARFLQPGGVKDPGALLFDMRLG
jgi:hypothetical protein